MLLFIFSFERQSITHHSNPPWIACSNTATLHRSPPSFPILSFPVRHFFSLQPSAFCFRRVFRRKQRRKASCFVLDQADRTLKIVRSFPVRSFPVRSFPVLLFPVHHFFSLQPSAFCFRRVLRRKHRRRASFSVLDQAAISPCSISYMIFL